MTNHPTMYYEVQVGRYHDGQVDVAKFHACLLLDAVKEPYHLNVKMSTKAASKCHSRRFFNGMLPRACPKHS